jgi:hypothetical protein
LAQGTGYVYEHRLVAEKKLGRKLRKNEMIHHVDGNKKNNKEENIEVVKDNLEHFFFHRKTNGKARRIPGEGNPWIKCACGCGKKTLKYDKNRRERRFIMNHNWRILLLQRKLNHECDENTLGAKKL